ncbi:MAG: M10 family metallopeptidase C-terminal domain-containing protein [Pseudomonadota bacterium]
MSADLTIETGAYAQTGAEAVDPGALGIEFLGWETFSSFTKRLTELEAPHVRWPGAIPVEDGIDTDGDGVRDLVFDLRAPDLITGWARSSGPREGLSDVLAVTQQAGASFAMIVPTARYVQAGIDGDAAALATARADIRLFLERLAAGAFGPVPTDFTLEIGTEYYATGVWKGNLGVADLAKRFGDVFAALADEVKATIADLNAQGLNAQGIDPTVAIQVGRLQSEDDAGNADGQFSDTLAFIQAFRNAGAEASIDALIWHRYIPTFDKIDLYVDRAPAAGYADPATALYATTEALWQDLAGKPLDLVGGWLSPSTRQGTSLEYGAPGLTNILQQFAVMVDLGMDTGSIFGFAADRAGSLGRAGVEFIGGQLYDMMIESLPGKVLQDGFQANTSSVAGGALVQSDQVNSYVFEDAEQIVVFLAAKDFAGPTLDYTVTVDAALSGAQARHLADTGGIDQLGPDQIGVVGDVRDTVPALAATAGGTSVTVRFTEDFEVIRLTLDKAPSAGVTVEGTAGRDLIDGTEAADVLDGAAGNDRLRAGEGDDRLIDGAGRDALWGGQGADIFVMVADGEPDTIKDFQSGVDRIDISAWGVTEVGQLDMLVSRTGKTVLKNGSETLAIDTGQFGIPDDILSGVSLDCAVAPAAPLVVEGTAGNDKVRGTEADEIIRDGAGRDALWGRGGSDVFQLVADGAPDAIKDLEVGVDQIDLSAWGATGIDDLAITQHKPGRVLVRYESEQVLVHDATVSLTVAELTAETFVFA